MTGSQRFPLFAFIPILSLVIPVASMAVQPGYYPPESRERPLTSVPELEAKRELKELLKRSSINLWIQKIDKIKIYSSVGAVPDSFKTMWHTRTEVANCLNSLPSRDVLLVYISTPVMWQPSSKSEALAQQIEPFAAKLGFRRMLILGLKPHNDGHTLMNPNNGLAKAGILVFKDTANKEFTAAPDHQTKVLNSNLFIGRAKLAYEAAASCPEILEHLFSYGGDDLTEGYSCLLDCFRTPYGAADTICQDEAILAASLFKQKVSLAEVQRTIDTKFSKMYPFPDDSSALKGYKATRLWDKNQSDR